MKTLDTNEKWSEEKDPRSYRQGDAIPEGDPVCIVPWTTICLSANGNIKPCCAYDADNDPLHALRLRAFQSLAGHHQYQ